MPEDRDFDYVVGKLPRKDKEGKDITGDKIGKGGRRRYDGTFSSMAYDLEVVDNDPKRMTPPEPRVTVRHETVEVPRKIVRYEDLSVGEQIIVDRVDRVVNSLVDCLTDRITRGLEEWLDNRRRKKEEKRLAKQRELMRQRQGEREARLQGEKSAKEQAPLKTEIVQKRPVMPDEFEAAYEQYSFNMTSEEAQKELVDAYILYILSAKKVWRVSHANITDSIGNVGNGRDMIEKLSNPVLLGSINEIIGRNPALLEEWQTMALAGILGRELVSNSQYIPIESLDLRKALLEEFY